MGNRFQIRHGSGKPNGGQIGPREFGFDSQNGVLYFRDNQEDVVNLMRIATIDDIGNTKKLYVARSGNDGETYTSGQILDYGFVGKQLWEGSLAVGGSVTIPEANNYRLFYVYFASGTSNCLVTKRDTNLRGGLVYTNSTSTTGAGGYMEGFRGTLSDAGLFTYTNAVAWSITSTPASNWGNSSTAARNITAIYGVC